MQSPNLFLILASGEIKGEGFWLIDIKNSDEDILDDRELMECHRKELIGFESAKAIKYAINKNLNNIKIELRKNNLMLDKPPKGIPFNIPLIVVENIFDFWIDIYKDQLAWEKCFGLLKIRERISLSSLINSDVIKGNSKKWALRIEDLHNYKPNSIVKDIPNKPMWH